MAYVVAARSPACSARSSACSGRRNAQVLREDVASGLSVGALDLDLHVEATGPQDRGVDHVLAVRGTDDDDVLESLDAVDLGEQLRDDRVLDVRADTRAASTEQRVHLVEEHDDGHALGGLLARTLEHQADVPLGLADVLVEQLGALDVEEERLALGLAGHLGDLLGEGVRDRLGDQRLATTRRAVKENSLGGLEFVLAEQVGVEVRQLDGVADLLDLRAEPTDRCVVDVGDLFEDELLDLGLGDALVDVARPRLQQQRVTRADRLVGQRVGEPDHALLIGVTDHQSALAVGEDLLEHDDLADALELHRADHDHGFVEHDLLAPAQGVPLDLGAQGHAQLAARGEDVDGAVVVACEEHAETGRRLRETVDLFLEADDLVARLTKGRGESLVLCRGRCEVGLHRGKAFLEGAQARLRSGLVFERGHVHHLPGRTTRPYRRDVGALPLWFGAPPSRPA